MINFGSGMVAIMTANPSFNHRLLVEMRNEFANLMGPFAWGDDVTL